MVRRGGSGAGEAVKIRQVADRRGGVRLGGPSPGGRVGVWSGTVGQGESSSGVVSIGKPVVIDC